MTAHGCGADRICARVSGYEPPCRRAGRALGDVTGEHCHTISGPKLADGVHSAGVTGTASAQVDLMVATRVCHLRHGIGGHQ